MNVAKTLELKINNMQAITSTNYLKNHHKSNLPNGTKQFELVVPDSDILFKRAQEYVFKGNNREMIGIINRLFATLLHLGCIGLAAPQIGISKRIIIFGMQHKHPKRLNEPAIPYTVLINPKITFFSEEQMIDYEGCCSIPGKIAWIKRSKMIKYNAYNIQGRLVQEEVIGLQSRIIQHEIDHLDGILITERALKIDTIELFKADSEYLNNFKENINKQFGLQS